MKQCTFFRNVYVASAQRVHVKDTHEMSQPIPSVQNNKAELGFWAYTRMMLIGRVSVSSVRYISHLLLLAVLREAS